MITTLLHQVKGEWCSMVPHDCLQYVMSFEPLTPNQLADNADCIKLTGKRCRLPDHSTLVLKFHTGHVISQSKTVPHMDQPYPRGKVCRKPPPDFLDSEIKQSALLLMTKRLQSYNMDQEELEK